MSNDGIHAEVKDVRKNYTRTPNMLFESYNDLHPQEKWLYINLVYLCGSTGTRHLSLRYISQRTGISLGALSGSKDPKKNNPGMLRNLHNAGLIHAEIKKVKNRDGTERDQAQYHITITDIWQLNSSFFAKRSECEHLEGEGPQSVRNVNTLKAERSENERERSENERERSENDTNIRLHSKITKQEDESDALCVSPTPPISSITHQERTEQGSLLPDDSKKARTKTPSASPEAQCIIERWIAANGGKPIPMTKALIEAAEALVECNPSKETLICVKNFAWLNDSNGWYKKHGGVKLGDIVREYEGWQNSQQQAQAPPSPPPPQPLHRTNLSASTREMAARYAAKKG